MLKHILTISIVLLLTTLKVLSQSNYQLVFQPGLSTIMGTEIVASTHFLFLDVEKKYLKPRLFNKPNRKLRNGLLNTFYRFSKTVIIDLTRDNFLRVFQHEVFGHGARFREYGFRRNSYYVGFPNGGGFASFGDPPENRIKSFEEELMIRLGGMESTALLSNKIRDNWMQSGMLDLGEAYFYASSFLGMNNYIRITNENLATLSNDVYNYYRTINRLNNIGLNETDFTIDFLKKRAVINYLNPLPYFALYSLIKDYIILGKEEIKLPTIPLGRFNYLPLIRMGFTPFGTEILFENFIRTDKSLTTVYFRKGDNKFHDFYGFGIKKTNIIKKDRLKIDGELDVWKQPEMTLGGEELQTVKEEIGAALKIGLGIKLFDEPNGSYFYGTFGYKSAGHLHGEFLRGGTFTRIGLLLIK